MTMIVVARLLSGTATPLISNYGSAVTSGVSAVAAGAALYAAPVTGGVSYRAIQWRQSDPSTGANVAATGAAVIASAPATPTILAHRHGNANNRLILNTAGTRLQSTISTDLIRCGPMRVGAATTSLGSGTAEIYAAFIWSAELSDDQLALMQAYVDGYFSRRGITLA